MRDSCFFLRDMQEALNRMIEVTTDCVESEFSQNWILISAVRDQIMILGEAAKQIQPEICEQYPEIPWSQLARTRDRLIHGYFKTDTRLLFNMATVRARSLLPIVVQICSDIQNQSRE